MPRYVLGQGRWSLENGVVFVKEGRGMSRQADVLLVTVTKAESKAVMEVFREATGSEPQPVAVNGYTYHDLGAVNGAQVFLATSRMGSGGVGGSQESVRKAIEALRPSAVIMVGIAFGVDEQKQAIGDVLVSDQLWLYELARVGKDEIVLRGDKPPASAWLSGRFHDADLYWDESNGKVRLGSVLSGEKLVDNLDYRNQLKQAAPEAVGGEMEGAGLYVACQNAKVDWILVKAICDWADGNKGKDKDRRQQLAAHNAARFVLKALELAPMTRDAKRRDIPVDAPLTTLPKPPACRSSLPVQPYFFGREDELKTIAEAVSPEARTWGALIDGPGGIGKTALAVRAAHDAPIGHFDRKLFLSAKVRELTPEGVQPLHDFVLPNFIALIDELGSEIGEENLEKLPPDERPSVVRRALERLRALIVIDNVETFVKEERDRLYQFLAYLPPGCKAIVTSRRRADIDARVIRLDKLGLGDALKLVAELAHANKHLAKASREEREELYAFTHGNPLLIRWLAGQLGRAGSRCRTVADACAFMADAPQNGEENAPLEYVFGDLLDTFTDHEAAVLAALAHFTLPARVDWIATVAGLPTAATTTALEDLADRALLTSDEEGQNFLLPPLAATFLRRKRPEAVARSGERLTDRVFALVLENGFDEYERFPELEAEWPAISAALPLFLQGKNEYLQQLCSSLENFLDFSGRWDEQLSLLLQGEEKAVVAQDFSNAGWRAFQAGWVHHLRRQSAEVLACSARCEAHWEKANSGAWEKASAIRLRGIGHDLRKDYAAAIEAFRASHEIRRVNGAKPQDVANALNDLANAEHHLGEYAAAESHYREALRIAKGVDDKLGVALFTHNLAELAIDRQDWSAAEALAREALPLAEEVGRIELLGANCWRLGQAIGRQGRASEGLTYARRGVEIFEKLRSPDLAAAEETLRECEAGVVNSEAQGE